jgi:hypothetical protein
MSMDCVPGPGATFHREGQVAEMAAMGPGDGVWHSA